MATSSHGYGTLADRQQRVVLNGSSSQWVNVTSGVPQGPVLAPLLFILYVNDITDGLKSTLEMFGDDSNSTGLSKHLEIQEDLNFISNWSKRWLLMFQHFKVYCDTFIGRGDHNT